MSFKFSIKVLGSLKWFMSTPSLLLIKYWYFASYGSFAKKYIFSMSSWFFIKFNNTFVFSDPEPPINNILYGWSGLYVQVLLCSVLFSLTYSSKLVIFIFIYLFIIIISLVAYGYLVILSDVRNLLSSLLLNVILFTSSVYASWY